MINLLPSDMRRELRAARSNTLLIRYVFLMLAAVGFLMLVLAAAYFLMMSARNQADQTITDNKAKAGSYAAVETEASTFRANLLIAKQIISNQTNYSDLLLKISAIIPNGVVLSGLNLDANSFGAATTIQARAKSTDDALALKRAFTDSALFSNAHFETIVVDDTKADYPYQVNISATINKGTTS